MSRLRRLVLRDTALDPSVLAVLGASSFPRLESLELWLGNFEYSWGGSAQDLLPLLGGAGFDRVRHLVLVSAWPTTWWTYSRTARCWHGWSRFGCRTAY